MSSNLTAYFSKARLAEMTKFAWTWNGSPGKTRADWQPFHVNSHFDAGEGFFLAHELELMRPGVYDIQYPENKAQRLIPWDTTPAPGAESERMVIGDYVGKPKVSRDMGGDTPMVGVSNRDVDKQFYSVRLGYQYSLQDVRASIQARRSLPVAKALACRQSMERELDTIAFQGEAITGITGLLNQTGTVTYTVPTTGGGGLATFASKDSDKILLDLNGPANKIYADSFEIEIPNQMLLPTTVNNLINSKRVGDGTSQTVKQYFLQSQDFIKNIDTSFRCEAANSQVWGVTPAATTGRMVVYRKDPAKMEMKVPQVFEQLQPMAVGFMVVTLCHLRTGGLFLYQPKSMAYADGIG